MFFNPLLTPGLHLPSPIAITPLPSVATDSEQLQLNCFLLGEPVDQVFAVKIAPSEPVDALKKVIKAEQPVTFQHVDSRSLVLRKVSLPMNESLEENLNNLSLVVDDGSPQVPTQLPNEELRSSMRILSEIFPGQPIEDHVHIVIQLRQTRSPLTQADLEEKVDIIAALKTGAFLTWFNSCPLLNIVQGANRLSRIA